MKSPDAKDGVLGTFAASNGFEYHAGRYSESGKPGTVFTHGHSRRISRVLNGQLPGAALPFSLYQYDYATGSGKHRRAYDLTVMEIVLPRKLPHMVIDSLVEHGNGQGSTLPIQFDKSQKLELEGDFYKYFTLYAPDKYAVSALTIIAPDAMEVLMKHAALCDIEIIDDRLFFYWPHLPGRRDEYEELFSTTEEVLGKIGKKLVRGDIFAHATQAQVHATAAEGVRLKPHNVGLIATLLIFGYVGFQLLAPMVDGALVGLGVLAQFLFFGVIFGSVAYREMRRRRLREELVHRVRKLG